MLGLNCLDMILRSCHIPLYQSSWVSRIQLQSTPLYKRVSLACRATCTTSPTPPTLRKWSSRPSGRSASCPRACPARAAAQTALRAATVMVVVMTRQRGGCAAAADDALCCFALFCDAVCASERAYVSLQLCLAHLAAGGARNPVAQASCTVTPDTRCKSRAFNRSAAPVLSLAQAPSRITSACALANGLLAM